MSTGSGSGLTPLRLSRLMQDHRWCRAVLDMPTLMSRMSSKSADDTRNCIVMLASANGDGWPAETFTSAHLSDNMKALLVDRSKLTRKQKASLDDGLAQALSSAQEELKTMPGNFNDCSWTKPGQIEELLKGSSWYKSLPEATRSDIPLNVAVQTILAHMLFLEQEKKKEDELRAWEFI